MTAVEVGAAVLELGLAARGAITKLRLWTNVEPNLFMPAGSRLSATEVAEIREFLRTPQARLVIAALGICYMTERNANLSAEFVGVFQSAFDAQIVDYTTRRNQGWADKKVAIWNQVISQLRNQLPRSESLVEDDDEKSSYLAFVQNPLYSQQGLVAKNRFQRHLQNVIGDLEALSDANDLARQIAESSRAATIPLFSHLPIDVAIDRGALYIDRDLAIEGHAAPVPSDQLFSFASYRLVLLGNPGAGKSTLVEHLRRMDDPVGESPRCTIVLKCREYAADISSSSLTDALLSASTRDLGLQDVTAMDLDLALTLGYVAVVFDGLDEILNAQVRMDFVQRVERFAGRYPLASILVTSRERGYEQAPLGRALFATIRLSEYTWPQVNEYATRWFKALGQPELYQPFMREVSGTQDIAINPLLLSLLCSLYKVDGHIPSNRYEVYNRCADLLFWRWDQHRQVRHREAVPNYGIQLMEFLGSTFFAHQAAQSGMDERQLVRLLSIYLSDTHGSVDPDARAQDFLDFCADRAWLLAVLSVNSKYGLRVFGFTHRTFYEYFSARSIARSENDPAVIAEYAIQQYKKDRSSFIPELLIQAADQARERNGARVFSAAMSKSIEPGLLLRLMNAPMRNDLRIEAFDKMALAWERSGAGIADIQGLQSLNSDARHQFLVQADGEWQPRGMVRLLDGWTRIGYLLQGEGLTDAWSRATYRELMRRYAPRIADLEAPDAKWPIDFADAARAAGLLLGLLKPHQVELPALLGRNPYDYPGILPALLGTGGSWIVAESLAGIPDALRVLEGSRFSANYGDDCLDIIQAGLPPTMDVKRWTSGQRDLAVALRLILRACHADSSRLDGALEEIGVLREALGGRVAWNNDQVPEWARKFVPGRLRFVIVAPS